MLIGNGCGEVYNKIEFTDDCFRYSDMKSSSMLLAQLNLRKRLFYVIIQK